MKKHTTINQSLSADVSTCMNVAVDLAKKVFQVAGEDALGQVIFEDRIKSREAFQAFLQKLPASVTVLVETGPGAQAWARLLQAQGNPVRILPAQHVANHRSGPKNDRNDALAILRAGRDCTISAVPVKS
ncbi:IS110 family transposase, partial [Pseudomonas extremaustralis]